MSRGAGDTIEIVQHEAVREFVAIGIPTFGLVNIFWASRLFGQLRHPMNRDVRVLVVVGTEVGLARNEIVSRIFEMEAAEPGRRCSHLLFVDDDVLVHPDLLLKLMADDRPIVGGLYYAKTSVPQPLVLHGESDGIRQSWEPGELVECWAHGMGATLIRMEVFRRLRDETALGADERGHLNYFETTRDAAVLKADGTAAVRNQTEDVNFLRKAAALGYVPTVDTGAQAFGWHWSQAEQRAFPIRQWAEYQSKGTITWVREGKPDVVWSARS